MGGDPRSERGEIRIGKVESLCHVAEHTLRGGGYLQLPAATCVLPASYLCRRALLLALGLGLALGLASALGSVFGAALYGESE